MQCPCSCFAELIGETNEIVHIKVRFIKHKASSRTSIQHDYAANVPPLSSHSYVHLWNLHTTGPGLSLLSQVEILSPSGNASFLILSNLHCIPNSPEPNAP